MTVDVWMVAVLAIVSGILSGFIYYRVVQRVKQRNAALKRLEKSIQDKSSELLTELYPESAGGVSHQEWKIISQTLLNNMASTTAINIAAPYTETEVNDKIEEFRQRLESVESRFPEEATLEKFSTLNDALLAKQMEELSKTVTEIKQNQLTKWDVVVVVFAIIAAIGTTVFLVNWIASL